jgi:hypothetical protein
MRFKEKAIIALNEVIYNKKNKLTKKDRETLLILREEIRNTKKKGLEAVLKKLVKFVGFNLFDDE